MGPSERPDCSTISSSSRMKRSIDLCSWFDRGAEPATNSRARRRSHVEIVLGAEVVLERDDRTDEQCGLGLHRLADELQRVAQPFAGDPELVECREVGLGEAVVEGPHGSIGGPGRHRHPVPDEPGGMRDHGRESLALRLDVGLAVAEEVRRRSRTR